VSRYSPQKNNDGSLGALTPYYPYSRRPYPSCRSYSTLLDSAFWPLCCHSSSKQLVWHTTSRTPIPLQRPSMVRIASSASYTRCMLSASSSHLSWLRLSLPISQIAGHYSMSNSSVFAIATTFRDSLRPHAKPTALEDTQSNVYASRIKTVNRDIIMTLKSPSIYLLSLFYFFMLGTGITAGGWVVECLNQARNGHLPDVGYVPAGLWGGVFLGRMLLAEPTYRVGERRMAMVYCVLILALQLVFRLVPSLVGGAVSISILGFFYGPMFATVRSMSKLTLKISRLTRNRACR
jgi:hypothetical protein